ncbi:hypothetical protein JTE90_002715 [Oedothorax gibbosus]|uniref:Bridge-like lipid transfer protein family member 1 C-terminal domain-containing protein n=1 Tax=Oedothorax gibbosus TaxID=931172 RepID=A0AAV6VX84_9ARAC|nr:hypothetical protein JTE90_002715 [Oedothorax gibbosus]
MTTMNNSFFTCVLSVVETKTFELENVKLISLKKIFETYCVGTNKFKTDEELERRIYDVHKTGHTTPGGASSGVSSFKQPPSEPNIDFELDVKVFFNSGKCVLHTKDYNKEEDFF